MTKREEPGTRKLHVRKVSQLVAQELKSEIMHGVLARGDSLPSEAALVDRFGVSRPTLREAIRILESEDLVRTSRGGRGGAKVQSPSVARAAAYAGMVLQFEGATIRDVLRTRAAILPPAARMAAEKADADTTPLDAWLAHNNRKMTDTREMFRESQRLELLIVDIAGSKTMRFVSDLLAHVTEGHIFEVPESLDKLPAFILKRIPIALDQANALIAAIKVGDPDRSFAIAQRRMVDEEKSWDRRVAYNERLKFIA